MIIFIPQKHAQAYLNVDIALLLLNIAVTVIILISLIAIIDTHKMRQQSDISYELISVHDDVSISRTAGSLYKALISLGISYLITCNLIN